MITNYKIMEKKNNIEISEFDNITDVLLKLIYDPYILPIYKEFGRYCVSKGLQCPNRCGLGWFKDACKIYDTKYGNITMDLKRDKYLNKVFDSFNKDVDIINHWKEKYKITDF